MKAAKLLSLIENGNVLNARSKSKAAIALLLNLRIFNPVPILTN